VIEGVVITPLRQIPDERGKIMHMMRCDDPQFERFGEIYFSGVYPGAIKAWHVHREMTLHYAVVIGMIKFVLYDARPGSPTHGELQEIFMGEQNYCRVRVPPGVYNGFKGMGTEMALVANCPTLPFDANEIERLDPFSTAIPYNWEIRHG